MVGDGAAADQLAQTAKRNQAFEIELKTTGSSANAAELQDKLARVAEWAGKQSGAVDAALVPGAEESKLGALVRALDDARNI